MTKEMFWEATKEPLRLMVLALIPFALAYFEVLPYEWATAITVFLRWLDKILHEIGVERSTARQESPLVTGLTRF